MDPLFYHSKQEQKNIFDGVEESIINKKNDADFMQRKYTLEDVKEAKKSVDDSVNLKAGNYSFMKEAMERPVLNDYIAVAEKEEIKRQNPNVVIDFDAAYTDVKSGDTEYMRTLKGTLKNYMNYRALLGSKVFNTLDEGQKRWVLESALDEIENLIGDCSSYMWGRWYGYLGSSHKAVRVLKDKAKAERKRLKKKYIKFIDKKSLKTKKAVDPHDRDIFSFNKGKYLRVDKSEKMDASDLETFKSKNYLAIRAEVDLDNDIFSAEQKKLIKDIGEYASILTTSALYIQTTKGSKESKQINKEIRLYSDIKSRLDTMRADESLSQDVKKRLDFYDDYFSYIGKGKLVVPKNKAVDDFSSPDMVYKNSKISRNDDGYFATPGSRVSRIDRTAEPLFVHEPCVSDIAQGSMGNCTTLAGIAKLVSMGSDYIKNMMIDDGNGNVTVRFYKKEENKYEPVYIKVNKVVNTSTAEKTLWVQVLCKAYAAFYGKYLTGENCPDASNKAILEMNNVETMPGNIIDYGFISNGGKDNTLVNACLGNDLRDAKNIKRMPRDQVYSDDYLISLYEINTPVAKQRESYNNGTIKDSEYAKIFAITGTSEVHTDVFYLKQPYKALMESSKKRNKKMFDDYAEAKSILSEYEEADKKYKNLNLLKAAVYLKKQLIKIFEQFYGDKNAFEYMGRVYSEDKMLTESQRQIGEKAFKEFANLYDNKLTDDNFLKQHKIDSKITRIIKVVNKEYFLSEFRVKYLGGKIKTLYGRKNVNYDKMRSFTFANHMSDRIPYYCNSCMSVMENSVRVKKPKTLEERREYNNAVYDKIKDMDYLHFMEIDTGNSLQELARALDVSEEEAFNTVKEALAEKNRLFNREISENKNEDYAKIFTGVYTEEALAEFNDIKSRIQNKEPVTTGTGKFNHLLADKQLKNGLAADHAYSILDVRDMTFKGKRIHMLKVRNPWGVTGFDYRWDSKTKEMKVVKSSNSNGIFFMELTHYMRTFGILS